MIPSITVSIDGRASQKTIKKQQTKDNIQFSNNTVVTLPHTENSELEQQLSEHTFTKKNNLTSENTWTALYNLLYDYYQSWGDDKAWGMWLLDSVINAIPATETGVKIIPPAITGKETKAVVQETGTTENMVTAELTEIDSETATPTDLTSANSTEVNSDIVTTTDLASTNSTDVVQGITPASSVHTNISADQLLRLPVLTPRITTIFRSLAAVLLSTENPSNESISKAEQYSTLAKQIQQDYIVAILFICYIKDESLSTADKIRKINKLNGLSNIDLNQFISSNTNERVRRELEDQQRALQELIRYLVKGPNHNALNNFMKGYNTFFEKVSRKIFDENFNISQMRDFLMSNDRHLIQILNLTNDRELSPSDFAKLGEICCSRSLTTPIPDGTPSTVLDALYRLRVGPPITEVRGASITSNNFVSIYLNQLPHQEQTGHSIDVFMNYLHHASEVFPRGFKDGNAVYTPGGYCAGISLLNSSIVDPKKFYISWNNILKNFAAPNTQLSIRTAAGIMQRVFAEVHMNPHNAHEAISNSPFANAGYSRYFVAKMVAKIKDALIFASDTRLSRSYGRFISKKLASQILKALKTDGHSSFVLGVSYNAGTAHAVGVYAYKENGVFHIIKTDQNNSFIVYKANIEESTLKNDITQACVKLMKQMIIERNIFIGNESALTKFSPGQIQRMFDSKFIFCFYQFDSAKLAAMRFAPDTPLTLGDLFLDMSTQEKYNQVYERATQREIQRYNKFVKQNKALFGDPDTVITIDLPEHQPTDRQALSQHILSAIDGLHEDMSKKDRSRLLIRDRRKILDRQIELYEYLTEVPSNAEGQARKVETVDQLSEQISTKVTQWSSNTESVAEDASGTELQRVQNIVPDNLSDIDSLDVVINVLEDITPIQSDVEQALDQLPAVPDDAPERASNMFSRMLESFNIRRKRKTPVRCKRSTTNSCSRPDANITNIENLVTKLVYDSIKQNTEASNGIELSEGSQLLKHLLTVTYDDIKKRTQEEDRAQPEDSKQSENSKKSENKQTSKDKPQHNGKQSNHSSLASGLGGFFSALIGAAGTALATGATGAFSSSGTGGLTSGLGAGVAVGAEGAAVGAEGAVSLIDYEVSSQEVIDALEEVLIDDKTSYLDSIPSEVRETLSQEDTEFLNDISIENMLADLPTPPSDIAVINELEPLLASRRKRELMVPTSSQSLENKRRVNRLIRKFLFSAYTENVDLNDGRALQANLVKKIEDYVQTTKQKTVEIFQRTKEQYTTEITTQDIVTTDKEQTENTSANSIKTGVLSHDRNLTHLIGNNTTEIELEAISNEISTQPMPTTGLELEITDDSTVTKTVEDKTQQPSTIYSDYLSSSTDGDNTTGLENIVANERRVINIAETYPGFNVQSNSDGTLTIEIPVDNIIHYVTVDTDEQGAKDISKVILSAKGEAWNISSIAINVSLILSVLKTTVKPVIPVVVTQPDKTIKTYFFPKNNPRLSSDTSSSSASRQLNFNRFLLLNEDYDYKSIHCLMIDRELPQQKQLSAEIFSANTAILFDKKRKRVIKVYLSRTGKTKVIIKEVFAAKVSAYGEHNSKRAITIVYKPSQIFDVFINKPIQKFKDFDLVIISLKRNNSTVRKIDSAVRGINSVVKINNPFYTASTRRSRHPELFITSDPKVKLHVSLYCQNVKFDAAPYCDDRLEIGPYFTESINGNAVGTLNITHPDYRENFLKLHFPLENFVSLYQYTPAPRGQKSVTELKWWSPPLRRETPLKQSQASLIASRPKREAIDSPPISSNEATESRSLYEENAVTSSTANVKSEHSLIAPSLLLITTGVLMKHEKPQNSFLLSGLGMLVNIVYRRHSPLPPLFSFQNKAVQNGDESNIHKTAETSSPPTVPLLGAVYDAYDKDALHQRKIDEKASVLQQTTIQSPINQDFKSVRAFNLQNAHAAIAKKIICDMHVSTGQMSCNSQTGFSGQTTPQSSKQSEHMEDLAIALCGSTVFKLQAVTNSVDEIPRSYVNASCTVESAWVDNCPDNNAQNNKQALGCVKDRQSLYGVKTDGFNKAAEHSINKEKEQEAGKKRLTQLQQDVKTTQAMLKDAHQLVNRVNGIAGHPIYTQSDLLQTMLTAVESILCSYAVAYPRQVTGETLSTQFMQPDAVQILFLMKFKLEAEPSFQRLLWTQKLTVMVRLYYLTISKFDENCSLEDENSNKLLVNLWEEEIPNLINSAASEKKSEIINTMLKMNYGAALTPEQYFTNLKAKSELSSFAASQSVQMDEREFYYLCKACLMTLAVSGKTDQMSVDFQLFYPYVNTLAKLQFAESSHTESSTLNSPQALDPVDHVALSMQKMSDYIEETTNALFEYCMKGMNEEFLLTRDQLEALPAERNFFTEVEAVNTDESQPQSRPDNFKSALRQWVLNKVLITLETVVASDDMKQETAPDHPSYKTFDKFKATCNEKIDMGIRQESRNSPWSHLAPQGTQINLWQLMVEELSLSEFMIDFVVQPRLKQKGLGNIRVTKILDQQEELKSLLFFTDYNPFADKQGKQSFDAVKQHLQKTGFDLANEIF